MQNFLGSYVVPHNFLARSVQPFGRLSVTNKKTPRQTKYIYRCDVKILHRPLFCFFLFSLKHAHLNIVQKPVVQGIVVNEAHHSIYL